MKYFYVKTETEAKKLVEEQKNLGYNAYYLLLSVVYGYEVRSF